jgi:hypothetical protein
MSTDSDDLENEYGHHDIQEEQEVQEGSVIAEEPEQEQEVSDNAGSNEANLEIDEEEVEDTNV